MSNRNIKQDIYLLTKSLISDIDELETKNLGKLVGLYERARQGISDFRDPQKRAERMDARDAAKEEALALKQARARTKFNRLTEGIDQYDAITPAQKRNYDKAMKERAKWTALLDDPTVDEGEKEIYRKRLATPLEEPTGRKRSRGELAGYGWQRKINRLLGLDTAPKKKTTKPKDAGSTGNNYSEWLDPDNTNNTSGKNVNDMNNSFKNQNSTLTNTNNTEKAEINNSFKNQSAGTTTAPRPPAASDQESMLRSEDESGIFRSILNLINKSIKNIENN